MPVLVSRQFDGLFNMDSFDFAFDYSFDWFVARVANVGGDGKMRVVQRWHVNLGDDLRMAQCDGAGCCHINIAPQSHVLVGRRGVPIDPRYGQVVRLRGENLDGQDVWLSGQNGAGDIELVGSIGAGNLFVISDELPIEPHVGTVVNAFEIQPDLSALRRSHAEFLAIPPGNLEWAVVGHRPVREIGADRIIQSWQRTKVHAEKRIGIDFVLDQAPHDS